ncbi:MAG: hypothetical protein PHT12_02185 [Patescibacteria group bacterium]|nr:hypothetical protein [Patescibacteria group bacterium]
MPITIVDLNAQAAALAGSIRSYVRDQIQTWQRVPWLALRAAMLGQSSATINRAYKFGYWHVCPTLAVDCANGDLCEFHDEDPHVATTEKLLEYATRLGIFDGEQVIEMLNSVALEGLMLEHLQPDEIESRRVALNEERKRLRLHPRRYDATMRLPLPLPEPPYYGG